MPCPKFEEAFQGGDRPGDRETGGQILEGGVWTVCLPSARHTWAPPPHTFLCSPTPLTPPQGLDTRSEEAGSQETSEGDRERRRVYGQRVSHLEDTPGHHSSLCL